MRDYPSLLLLFVGLVTCLDSAFDGEEENQGEYWGVRERSINSQMLTPLEPGALELISCPFPDSSCLWIPTVLGIFFLATL